MWRATYRQPRRAAYCFYFYPRPPCGGRHFQKGSLIAVDDFYPRPPCGGRPLFWRAVGALNAFLSTPSVWRATCDPKQPRTEIEVFLSTPSVWRATVSNSPKNCSNMISIHALRVEGDVNSVLNPFALKHFYPRPPCGGRRKFSVKSFCIKAFLSTPSVWRATCSRAYWQYKCNNFYPRPPCGGRQLPIKSHRQKAIFLSTPSVWRATIIAKIRTIRNEFLSTPSVWRATGGMVCMIASLKFLSTPSVWRAT